MKHPTSHSSWVLNYIIDIDRLCVGFCGEFFRMSDERRQVIAAYLSAKPPSAEHMADVGRFLLGADHRAILAAGYGEVQQGHRRALRRAGSEVQDRRFYSLLHQLLANPPHDQIAHCVAHLPSLDLTKLLVLHLLPPSICRANVVSVIRGTQEANDVEIAFRLLISRGVDADALTHSIRQVQDFKALAKVFENAMLRAKAPAHPVPASSNYQPILTGEELHALARQFQNCARSYSTRLLDENEGHAFALVQHGKAKAVAHLIRDGSVWELDGLFGYRNSRPTRDLRDWVYEYLAGHGVKVEKRNQRKSSDWESLRRLTSDHLLDFGFA